MSRSSQFIPETKDQEPVADAGVNHVPAAGGNHSDGSPNSMLASILERMAEQWRAGSGRPAELWLAEFPQLAEHPEDAVRVVYEEFCLREEHDEHPETEQYYRRFPQWRDQLAVVLQCHKLFGEDDPPRFPEPGQCLGELRLISELGRGAVGRVFLATQPSLSDRLLAVKITPRRGKEHLSLARLQHTHIVPLYLVQDFPQEDLRAICMPFLGRATWGAILKRLQKQPLAKRSGAHIVQHLFEEQSPANADSNGAGPAITFLNQSSYVEAVCWIGACLTDALHYAHQRGLVHLDIKPSNVLLSCDGQPMLLDFHIACPAELLQNDTIERIGGTLDYMSPEQRTAVEAIRRGESLENELDARSDIYSLGVLLYESLAGQLPAADPIVARRILNAANPQVSRGLTDILCKCLAGDPAARYQNAGQLATDLRRHLASLPLRGVGNRSLLERWQKYRRRKPYATALVATALTAILVAGTLAGMFYCDRTRSAEALMLHSQQELADQEFDNAIKHASDAWEEISLFPWKVELKQQVKLQIAAAEQQQAKSALHDLVEQLRFLDDQPLAHAKLEEVAAGCAKVWQKRETFTRPAGEAANSTGPGQPDPRLQRDLLDLAVISARLEVQLASPDTIDAARRSAIQRLNEAAEMCGDSAWLTLERHEYESGAGQADRLLPASLPHPANCWEHYDLGWWLMRHGQLADAQQQFTAAVDLKPDEFWPHFQQMRCAFQLHHFDQALTAASVCVALAPQQPQCYYNRALCEQSLSNDQEALDDFSRALQIDSTFGPAALARGILLGKLHRLTEAQSDLELAAKCGTRPSEVFYQMACLSLLAHDPVRAKTWLQKSLADDPHHSDALALQSELAAQAVSAGK